jgi:uncharacterized repeat protein (TIGR01451 family)
MLSALRAVGVLLFLHAAATQAAAITGADTAIVFGKWDGSNNTATQPGEVTFELSSTVTGVPADSLKAADTVRVDSGFAFSSLDSLGVPDDTSMNKAYDTVYFRYAIQNQSNVSDSFSFKAGIQDTANAQYFAPVDFDFVSDTAGADVVAGMSNGVDSAWYGLMLSQESVDTFFVRVVLPGAVNAADGDSLVIGVEGRGHYGSGADDGWPLNRVIIDTVGSLWHTRGDTMRDYGDDQLVTNFLTVSEAQIHLKSLLDKVSVKPGDTLNYAMRYDNDGSAATPSTVSIQQLLPKYVQYVPGSAMGAYHSGESGTVINFSALASPTSFIQDMTWANSHADSVAGVKWTFGQPIGADDLDDVKGVADDSTAGQDAGSVMFRVIVK